MQRKPSISEADLQKMREWLESEPDQNRRIILIDEYSNGQTQTITIPLHTGVNAAASLDHQRLNEITALLNNSAIIIKGDKGVGKARTKAIDDIPKNKR